MKNWILAIRPKTLPAVISPLLVGNALAIHLPTFNWYIAFICMVCGLLLQIAVNLANDYFDYKSGIDTNERLGPERASQKGLIAPKLVCTAMYISLICALLIGSILIYHGGFIIAILATLATLGALGYSGGPYPLASHGLGEVAAFLFFGLIAVAGSFYLQSSTATALVWILAAAVGCFNAAIMLVNNTRDIITDAKAGKNTLAIKMGEKNCHKLYIALLSIPFILLIIAFLIAKLPLLPTIAPWLATILVYKLSSKIVNAKGVEYNAILAKTAALNLVYSLLFSTAFVLTLK